MQQLSKESQAAGSMMFCTYRSSKVCSSLLALGDSNGLGKQRLDEILKTQLWGWLEVAALEAVRGAGHQEARGIIEAFSTSLVSRIS